MTITSNKRPFNYRKEFFFLNHEIQRTTWFRQLIDNYNRNKALSLTSDDQ